MTDKQIIHILGNFLGQMPQVDKALKKLMLNYLNNYEKFAQEERKNKILTQELEQATKYIAKLEKEKEELVH